MKILILIFRYFIFKIKHRHSVKGFLILNGKEYPCKNIKLNIGKMAFEGDFINKDETH
jgi:hypothetical protein